MRKIILILTPLLFISYCSSAFSEQKIFTCPYQARDIIMLNKQGWQAGKESVGDQFHSYHFAFVESERDINADGTNSLVCGFLYFDDDRNNQYKFSRRFDYMKYPVPLKSNGELAKCSVYFPDGAIDDDDTEKYIAGVRQIRFICDMN